MDTNKAFPFLGMEFCWNIDNNLQYRVHLKDNQVIKYLNRGSNHPKACFKAIYTGVLKRLSALMAVNKDTVDKKLDELYPKHAAALAAADLHPGEYPTLQQTIKHYEETAESNKIKRKKQNEFKRQTFFPAGCHFVFDKPIIAILMEARHKHSIKYLHPTMSYHKFPNITELFQSDLNKKIMNQVVSLDINSRDCNCSSHLKNDKGECIFNGKCRHTAVIYKVTCTTCEANGKPKYYIGSTQNTAKHCCSDQHTQDVCKLVNEGTPSDSFAKHFAQHFTGDGIKVNFDSPEAFDEVFWLTYCKRKYVKPDHLIPHTPSEKTMLLYRKYIQNITPDNKRYLSKNNNKYHHCNQWP